AAISAPTMVIPEMAFEPDMSGVCSWDGTLAINSKPRKTQRMKIKIRRIIVNWLCSLALVELVDRLVHDPSVVSQETVFQNFVCEIQAQGLGLLVPKMFEQTRQVVRIHLAGVPRDASR